MKLVASFLCALPLLAQATPLRLVEVDRIALGGDARWDYLSVDSAAHRLYVAHGNTTDVVDTRTDQRIGTIADTEGVHGIAIASDLGLGFISDGKANAVTVFELASLKTVARIPVGQNPDAIVYDPTSRRVLAFDGKSHEVTLIDAARHAVVATLPVGGKPEFAQLGEGGLAWFNLEDTSEMAVLDAAAGKIVRRQSLAPCESPSGLAVDPQNRLYAVCENMQMVVVAPQGQVLGRTPIGEGADGVAWLDGAAWSANGGDGTISVVQEDTPGHFTTTETVPSAPGGRTIAADPATHRLYLPTADLQPGGSGEHRIGKPGTFHVLVMQAR